MQEFSIHTHCHSQVALLKESVLLRSRRLVRTNVKTCANKMGAGGVSEGTFSFAGFASINLNGVSTDKSHLPNVGPDMTVLMDV